MKCKSDASAADLKGDLISYTFNSAIHQLGLQMHGVLNNTQKGAGLQLSHQLISRQSPSPFRLHLTEHQSNPVIAPLRRTDRRADGALFGAVGVRGPLGHVNGYISAPRTHRLLPADHSF